jgi:hypothetical protein
MNEAMQRHLDDALGFKFDAMSKEAKIIKARQILEEEGFVVKKPEPPKTDAYFKTHTIHDYMKSITSPEVYDKIYSNGIPATYPRINQLTTNFILTDKMKFHIGNDIQEYKQAAIKDAILRLTDKIFEEQKFHMQTENSLANMSTYYKISVFIQDPPIT